MRSAKKYTNQTFTKRVDHEGGPHRPFKSIPEPAVCGKCGSIYADRRWSLKTAASEDKKHDHWRPAATITCPACVQIEQGVVGGYLNLAGRFFTEHREEIMHLLEHEEDKAAEDNPLSRVMRYIPSENLMTVETTTEHLAQRLGHAVEKAYRGEISYDFSHENKVARVNWRRD